MEHYTTRVSTLENTVNTISQEVRDIKQNYLTTSAFYRSGVLALVVLVGASWALYSHMDTKYENRFSGIDQKFQSVDQRFEKVESAIHSLDVRLTKVESRLDNVELRLTNVEKKLDTIDDKLDILIQQKQAKNN
ncbi:hypothetical protein BKG95_03680 [Rodentibacter pneumotropicus]|nr:hypothetical protein BKG95_03680 [Rodentibacter pneumotropicus]THA07266.1 DUF2730 family protein [Rodentibacter pneumotropicus]THA10413.1 DUF2730 family protein [Rodentibacter pneumotropicus]THA16174.1 DUF2730 family protein [Rodentibacter pneumotropicus]